MNATANRPRQQRQMLVLGVLIVALAVIVVVQVLPLLGGESTPPPPAAAAPVAARPATPAPKPATRASAATSGRQSRTTQTQTSRTGAAAGGVLASVEEVHLAKLQEKEPEPIDGHRNPFTFGPDPKVVKQQADAAERAKQQQQAMAAAAPPPPIATGPPPPPPPPPITLKFFGVVTAPGRIGKVAALGDGKFVYHGREGEIVEGRYRIVKIGEESIQLEYVDGRGRQTIRLSGK